mmetsp:Transcript_31074/g.88682  ORF Transcript_31074/g.88682 Transcript_31074/m.88682 type:complete len:447 (-) Transcript_31074:167-1507(-)
MQAMAVAREGALICDEGRDARSVADAGATPSVGLAKSIFNFTTLIIGGGLLGWPNSFRLCGWLGGAICLAVCCLFAETTMCLMVNIAIDRRTRSYEETCCAIWGRAGYYVITITCYLMDFGILVTYWVALGDLLAPAAESIFQSSASGVRLRVKIVLGAVMLLPCYLRNLGEIPGWSYINYSLIVFGLFSMLALSGHQATADFNKNSIEPKGLPTAADWTSIKPDLWPSLGTLAFTFCTHDCVFMIYSTLQDGTSKRWAATCKTAMWSTVVLMVATGLPIYFALGDKVSSDLTVNFPDSPWMRVVRCALAVSIGMTWVYLQQVARKFLHSLAMPFVRGRPLTEEESYHMSGRQLFVFTSVQFAATWALGLCIEDLGLPMALTGVFAQSLAAFVIPPCLLFTECWRRGGNVCGYSFLAKVYFCVVLLFGVTSCTLGVHSTIASYTTA